MEKVWVKGETIVCISKEDNLTIGNYYIIEQVLTELRSGFTTKDIRYKLLITNDKGFRLRYYMDIFVDVATYRNRIINNILK